MTGVRAAVISNGYVLPNGAQRNADAKLDEQFLGDPVVSKKHKRTQDPRAGTFPMGGV